MKRLCAIILCLITLFVFASCTDDSDPVVKDLSLEVEFSLNRSKSANSKVCLNTNLPVGTKLDVDIFVGNIYHSTETVEVKADIETNYFITESQVDLEGNKIEDGNYILSVVLVDPEKQSDEVKAIIGEKGERLSGDYVYETEDGKTIKLQRPLVKKNDNFSMPDN